jgi:hypothetical protein
MIGEAALCIPFVAFVLWSVIGDGPHGELLLPYGIAQFAGFSLYFVSMRCHIAKQNAKRRDADPR